METTILKSKTKTQNKESNNFAKDVVIERLRLNDWQISQKIDQQERKKEKAVADKKAAADKKKLSFSDFCKELEYRKNAVYFRSKHLFNKYNAKINSQNERIFYDYLTENNLILTY